MNTNEILKTYVVHNPVSGPAQTELVREHILRVMDENQIPYELYETTGKEKLYDVVKAAIEKGFEQFIAVGGDGTVSGVASGLVNTNIPLVILPAGTVNALARELGIPIGIDNAAGWWLSDRQIRKIDVMQIKDRYFLMNISVGVSAEIVHDVDRSDINRLGVLAFIRNAMGREKDLPFFRFQVTIDKTLTYIRASELFIANSGILLGLKAFTLDPNADLDTGRMSVCYARIRTVWDYVRIALKIIAAPNEGNDELHCTEARREVRIHTNRPVPIQGDGDKIGTTPVTITLVPRALNVVVPRL
jgi:diacylglycerol kinase (ATP)